MALAAKTVLLSNHMTIQSTGEYITYIFKRKILYIYVTVKMLNQIVCEILW